MHTRPRHHGGVFFFLIVSVHARTKHPTRNVGRPLKFPCEISHVTTSPKESLVWLLTYCSFAAPAPGVVEERDQFVCCSVECASLLFDKAA